MRTYTVLLYRDPNQPNDWIGVVPAVPGVISDGNHADEALAMTTEALEAMLEHLLDEGRPLPEDRFDLERAKREASDSLGGASLEFLVRPVNFRATVSSVAA